ncbi:protein phosphatase [Grosmannia clavigera kw1407]|uniref:U three protein 23 n=1 Tax=Grosmannia clavigera (strain kw1407 / UAMH 11150) TaxID=655863 RepID=F0XSC7_GROCL|nr:protein phosphatase [Grosmannia clavigera kw1407]EFW99590.1 protein phosphatase [Grosmannia clavigera kw1407]
MSSTAIAASPDPCCYTHDADDHNDADLPYNRCGRPPFARPSPPQPFRFDTGVGMFAKRTPRPFPPPFYSPPSASFSDPLSTHHLSRDRRRAVVGGQLIGGCTNGDDAVYASEYFVAANDGVGAWSTRPRGHAGLWARLVAHFWADAVYNDLRAADAMHIPPDPARCLQQAYEQTMEATQAPNDWQGTTTATGAQLSYHRPEPTSKGAAGGGGGDGRSKYEPMLYVTNLGDSQVMVVRPAESLMVFKTKEQWHWFDCPRQLGTNSPDTPLSNAVVDTVPIHVGDVVLAMSDGVIDNLWSHEIVERVSRSVATWQAREKTDLDLERGMMAVVAEELVEAARVIAVDPYAESPYMEHAIEEGLPSEGDSSEADKDRMRAKRSKQYKKLVQQFNLHHGFREPYQVLVDADLVRDAQRFTMDLQAGLERTLHGKVKIMITQCCIRHLYAQGREDRSVNKAIDLAKTFERRRCGHKPEEFEEPLSTLACLGHVVDEKGRGENKHRYVVASQDQDVRRHMRGIAGVPLIYISRSVMIMEPMSAPTAKVGVQAERAKFRSELRKLTGEKRKRTDDDDGTDSDASDADDDKDNKDDTEKKKKKKKQYGLKAPNPLSIKKRKDKTTTTATALPKSSGEPAAKTSTDDAAPKRKRKRKHKHNSATPAEAGAVPVSAPAAVSDE